MKDKIIVKINTKIKRSGNERANQTKDCITDTYRMIQIQIVNIPRLRSSTINGST